MKDDPEALEYIGRDPRQKATVHRCMTFKKWKEWIAKAVQRK